MHTICALIVAMAVTVAFVPVNPETHINIGPFLMKVSEQQQADIAIGLLATQRAENERVKALSVHITEEHQRVNREIEALASTEHVQLRPGLNQSHEQQVRELSQLSGHDFDLAYLNCILRDHESIVTELEKHVKTLRDRNIRSWIDETLPILGAHHEQARLVARLLQTRP